MDKRNRDEAPGITIDILPFSVSTDSPWDRVDAQIRLTPGRLKPKAVRSQRLMADDIVVLMRPDHPSASEPMTAELYASLPHVKLSQASTGTTVIDDSLAHRGLERHCALIVSSWDPSSEKESGHKWLCETIVDVFDAQIRPIGA